MRPGRTSTKDEEKRQWIEDMKALKSDGIQIVSYRDIKIKRDDGFISGDVIISVKYNDDIYEVKL